MAIDPWIFGPLRCFEIAGRLLNFTRAAEALNLTQSAVSQQIRLLEERLGSALFVRHARGLRLTPKGSMLLESVQNGFTEITSTIERFGMPRATLEVDCLPSLALHWLVPRLSTFYRQNLNASIRVTAELRPLTNRMLQDEGIDVGIRYEPLDRRFSSAELLMEEYLIPVATPEYLARHPRFQAQQSCEGVTFLHDASPWHGASEHVEWRLWLETNQPKWLGYLAGPQFNLASMMISAALNHQGVALGRTAIVFDELKTERLIDVFRTYVCAPARYILLYPRSNRERSTAFRKWICSESRNFEQDRQQLLPALSTPSRR